MHWSVWGSCLLTFIHWDARLLFSNHVWLSFSRENLKVPTLCFTVYTELQYNCQKDRLFKYEVLQAYCLYFDCRLHNTTILKTPYSQIIDFPSISYWLLLLFSDYLHPFLTQNWAISGFYPEAVSFSAHETYLVVCFWIHCRIRR